MTYALLEWKKTRLECMKKYLKCPGNFDQHCVLTDLTHHMESCVSSFYFTYCLFYAWRSSLYITIFQRATQQPRRRRQTKYSVWAAVVSTITSYKMTPFLICIILRLILNLIHITITVNPLLTPQGTYLFQDHMRGKGRNPLRPNRTDLYDVDLGNHLE